MTDEIIAPLIYEEDNASKEKNDNENEEKFRNYENDNEKERLLEYERALIVDRDNRENLQNQEIRENRENIITKLINKIRNINLNNIINIDDNFKISLISLLYAIRLFFVILILRYLVEKKIFYDIIKNYKIIFFLSIGTLLVIAIFFIIIKEGRILRVTALYIILSLISLLTSILILYKLSIYYSLSLVIKLLISFILMYFSLAVATATYTNNFETGYVLIDGVYILIILLSCMKYITDGNFNNFFMFFCFDEALALVSLFTIKNLVHNEMNFSFIYSILYSIICLSFSSLIVMQMLYYFNIKEIHKRGFLMWVLEALAYMNY